MNKFELHEKIEDYLKNRLSPEARAAFESKMRTNPELAKEVELHRDLMAATGEKEVSDLRRQMEEIYREQPGATIKEMPRGGGMTVAFRRVVLAAAAAVLVGIVAVTVFKPWEQPSEAPIAMPNETSSAQPDIEKPGGEVAELPPSPLKSTPKPQSPQRPSKKQIPADASKSRYIAMAEESYQKSSEEWAGTLKSATSRGEMPIEEKAEMEFAKKEYSKVVTLLASSADTLSPVATYLRGHAYFRLENYAAAAADFRNLVSNEGYSADAEWYLLFSLLAQKGGDDPEAKQLIKQMRKADDHPYRSDLQRLLPKIRSR